MKVHPFHISYCLILVIKNGFGSFKVNPFFTHWLGDEESNLNSRSQSGTEARNKAQGKEDKDTEDIKKT
ncbi:MAG: hypothetical protein A2V86_01260 [Deltaproteobacteria bacterium RBG_16_49_23]|nr:MAG: hypothetical protein A2V86_01260 [Deltaproteobacteria bacterium RBG_16_49_23]